MKLVWMVELFERQTLQCENALVSRRAKLHGESRGVWCWYKRAQWRQGFQPKTTNVIQSERTTSLPHDVIYHDVGGRKTLSQQCSDYVNNFLVKFREAEHFLLNFRAAMLNDSLHLLVNQFNAPQRRIFEASNLTFHQQFKRNLIK